MHMKYAAPRARLADRIFLSFWISVITRLKKTTKRTRKASENRMPSKVKGPISTSKVFENMKDTPLATTREIINT